MNRPHIHSHTEAAIEALTPVIKRACGGILVPRADNFTPPERTPWGGTLIPALKAKLGIETAGVVGESWEISGHPSFPNLIPFELKVRTIEVPLWLIGKIAPDKLYGPANVAKFGDNPPFLTKLLNSAHGHNLSIQIHPDAEYARKNPKWHSKTEMWVILDAEPGAGIYIGLTASASEETMRAALTDGKDISPYLNFVEAHPGDIFFLPAGTPHAIGGGLLLLEQQETSETTFRYYSWGDGRELHIKDALACTHWDTARGIPFVDEVIRRKPVVIAEGDEKTARHELLANEKEFSYDRVSFTAASSHDGNAAQGMHGVTITDGSLAVETAGASFGPFPAGQSFIVPAAAGTYRLVASSATATAYIGRSDPRSER
jgi:mannose-6-phosphate isomerase